MFLVVRRATWWMGALAAAFSTPSQAQARPDAATQWHLLQSLPQALPLTPAMNVPDAPTLNLRGGPTVEVRKVQVLGNHSLTEAALLDAVNVTAVMTRPIGIEQMQALATNMTAHYRAQGFPFAFVFLPAQDLSDGTLILQVLEGQYGAVQAKSPDPRMTKVAGGHLQALVAGEVIRGPALERATLLLGDLPGVKVVPVMKPGAQTGQGDLEVWLEQQTRATSTLQVDNHGNRYTGAYRVQINAAINRLWVVGDQLILSGMAPVRGLWLASASYAWPLGQNGWRAQAATSRLQYTLKEEFTGFHGLADVRSGTLSHPVIRSRALNVAASVTYQHKDLQDISILETTHKTAQTTPVVASFDWRDGWLGGGLSYGTLSWVTGRVYSAADTRVLNKWALDLSRIQTLSPSWELFGRWFLQHSPTNLDSSEKALLGGPAGVRAYPSGEAAGDRAWLLQAELRTQRGPWAPYLFYDHGKVQVDARPELVRLPSADKVRAGAGMGLRAQARAWSVNIALAWPTQGGAAEADTKTAAKPRAWAEMRYTY